MAVEPINGHKFMTEERRQYEREWRKRNKGRVREVNTRWRKAHPEIIKESDRKYSMKHPEVCRERKKRWVLANTERNRLNNKTLHQNYKRAVIDAYGGHCQCCGENDILFLTLEHTKRDGQTHRKVKGVFYLSLIRRRFPKDEGLSVLCMNCNWATRLGAKCPHQKQLMEVIG